MKKGLIVLLIFILVVGAFVFGTKVNSNTSTDITATSLETPELSLDTTVSSENISTELTTFSDVHYEKPDTSPYEYQPEGFEIMGKNCNTILRIHDYYISKNLGESYIIIDRNLDSSFSYYLEYPYAASCHAHTNWDMFKEEWDYSKSIFVISDVEIYYDKFEFYDNYTLAINPGDVGDEKRIVIDKIINISESGTIFEANIDRFGVEYDEEGYLFFMTDYDTLATLLYEEFGEEVYAYDEYFNGYSKVKVFF